MRSLRASRGGEEQEAYGRSQGGGGAGPALSQGRGDAQRGVQAGDQEEEPELGVQDQHRPGGGVWQDQGREVGDPLPFRDLGFSEQGEAELFEHLGVGLTAGAGLQVQGGHLIFRHGALTVELGGEDLLDGGTAVAHLWGLL